MKERSSGVLLHISSLPSAYGVGDFGTEAREFVSFLKQAKQKVWQILPLSITNPITGNSPYSSLSAFALNPIFVSPDLLIKDGLLTKEEAAGFTVDSSVVDYAKVEKNKKAMLNLAFGRLKKNSSYQESFTQFKKEEKAWLDDVAMFLVLKELYSERAWTAWPDEYKARNKEALKRLCKEHKDLIEWYKFIQFVLWQQWFSLRDYCTKNKVVLLGDMPIYVEHDSVDVWANPEIFKLNDRFEPEVVAGVPPDYFSATGQRWGNPLYNWDALKENHFEWWIGRIEHHLELYDLVRIDHFRGLVNFWEIPATEKTAINGKWMDVPVNDFMKALKKHFPKMPFIAEDLGIINDQVREVMKEHKLAGMKILLFAFNGDMGTHPYLPHNFTERCVVYTGTHDNNTTRGWFDVEAQDYEKVNMSKYLGDMILNSEDISWDLIELALSSKAMVAIFPMQDILSLGKEARMNTPGTTHGNWQWRFNPDQLSDDQKKQLSSLTAKYHRA